ncbi:4'-phosphopantetheinyl transferase family protein [Moraxella marmotae]|uniref:4'-phosphopantetheinyl transferase family protein n=1 Tax=Moraxella marmotae TaxID=3344520 RepID=UPI0035F4FE0E
MTATDLYHSPCLICPADGVIIAHAKMRADDVNSKNLTQKTTHRQRQSASVRALLAQVMADCGIVGNFIDGQFPYQIISDNARHFVSFSHSGHAIALIVAATPCAIDIEQNTVNPAIAERYYHANELDIIKANPSHAQHDIDTLWRLKECAIKLSVGKLHAGMQADFSTCLAGIHRTQPVLIDHQQWRIYNEPTDRLTAVFECIL